MIYIHTIMQSAPRRRLGPSTTVAAALVLAACLGQGAGSSSGYAGAGGGGGAPAPQRPGQPVRVLQQHPEPGASSNLGFSFFGLFADIVLHTRLDLSIILGGVYTANRVCSQGVSADRACSTGSITSPLFYNCARKDSVSKPWLLHLHILQYHTTTCILGITLVCVQGPNMFSEVVGRVMRASNLDLLKKTEKQKAPSRVSHTSQQLYFRLKPECTGVAVP